VAIRANSEILKIQYTTMLKLEPYNCNLSQPQKYMAESDFELLNIGLATAYH